MRKDQFLNSVITIAYQRNFSVNRLVNIAERFEERIKGTSGAPQKRKQFLQKVQRLADNKDILNHQHIQWQGDHETRKKRWLKFKAEQLAKKAGYESDEHGRLPGDYRTIFGRDFVPPWESDKAPYHDSGNRGLGLVAVIRKRIYAKSCQWYPSTATTAFLVGRNENGTYFAHPVPANIDTVKEAVQWIWNNKADQIIQRQGDIALIWGPGPKLPELPTGHTIEGNYIIHESHDKLPLPDKGTRIIVGRRASEQASSATRD